MHHHRRERPLYLTHTLSLVAPPHGNNSEATLHLPFSLLLCTFFWLQKTHPLLSEEKAVSGQNVTQ